METLLGLNIVSSPLVRDVQTKHVVERVPIKKKRRQWRVVKRTTDRPGCWNVGGVLYMHPELIDAIRARTQEPT